jgi:hypothetical protein
MTAMTRAFVTAFLALAFAAFAALTVAAEEAAPVGYGGAKVQMQPLMAPYRTSGGVRYEPVTVRLTLDAGPKERPACFSIPIVHDRMVRFLHRANLTAADLAGQRREVLAQRLFEVALKATGKGFYSAAEIVDIEPRPDDPKAAPPMDNKSMTLSAQCK